MRLANPVIKTRQRLNEKNKRHDNNKEMQIPWESKNSAKQKNQTMQCITPTDAAKELEKSTVKTSGLRKTQKW